MGTERSDPAPFVSSGALIGGRHIGQLCAALDRYRVTPDRYTVQSLADTLNELTASRRLPAPAQVEVRDRLAWFVWMIKKMDELTTGETNRERSLREAAAARQRHREQQQRLVAEMIAVEEIRAESQEAAAAFFLTSHIRPTRHRLSSPLIGQTTLVKELIGNARLYDTPPAVQTLVGHITALDRHLNQAGWKRTATTAPAPLRWIRSDVTIEIPLEHMNPDQPLTTSLSADEPDSELELLVDAVHRSRRSLTSVDSTYLKASRTA